jgi:hypothetical protein
MKHQDITLHLNDIRDLFVAPAIDPFSEHETAFMGQSGLERVVSKLIEVPAKHPVPRIIVKLPKEKITPDLQTTVCKIINRYANTKILENEHRRKILRASGFRELWPGLVFLILCLIIATIIKSPLIPWSDSIKSILGEGFTIIGWVVLWHPVEFFLYGPSELRKENRTYKLLKRLAIEIDAV